MPIEVAGEIGRGENSVEKQLSSISRRFTVIVDEVEGLLQASGGGELELRIDGGLDERLGHVGDTLLGFIERLPEAATTRVAGRLYGAALKVERLRAEHERLLLGERIGALTSVRYLGHGLRPELGVAELMARAAAEVCRVSGVDRAMVFNHEGGSLVATSTYFAGSDDWAEQCQGIAQSAPITLLPHLLETKMVRLRRPAIMVKPMEDPNAFRPIVQTVETPGYIAVPVIAHGRVAATIAADTYFAGRLVDEADRDAVAAFGVAFGRALETAVLLEQFESQRDGMRTLLGNVETAISALRDPAAPRTSLSASAGVKASLAAPGAYGAVEGARAPVGLGMGSSSALKNLTRRELEVLSLMTSGATNAEIAAELVVAEGTIKTHVRRILHKTASANRGQAVALYMRNTPHALG